LGVASKNVYYLPLKAAGQTKEPEVCAIDLERGVVQAHTKSRKKENVPGNLLLYDDYVISQSVDRIAVYPQLQAKLALIDKSLEKNPKDPVGLTERGELRLDKGDVEGAVNDLRTALANRPSAELLPKTQAKLFESFTESFQK